MCLYSLFIFQHINCYLHIFHFSFCIRKCYNNNEYQIYRLCCDGGSNFYRFMVTCVCVSLVLGLQSLIRKYFRVLPSLTLLQSKTTLSLQIVLHHFKWLVTILLASKTFYYTSSTIMLIPALNANMIAFIAKAKTGLN